jgi:hypothetical protein
MFVGTVIASENNQTTASGDTTASNNLLAQMSAKERHEHMKAMKANHPNIKKMANKRAEHKEERRAQANKNIMDRTKKFN